MRRNLDEVDFLMLRAFFISAMILVLLILLTVDPYQSLNLSCSAKGGVLVLNFLNKHSPVCVKPIP